MTLVEKYQYRSRRKKTNLKLYIILAIFFILATTLARYTNILNPETKLQIAKWNIKINNEVISTDTKTLKAELNLFSEDGEMYEIIRTGDTGYVEIKIDPTGTEVAVDYQIILSVIKNSNGMQSNINFTGYSLNGETEKHILLNNTIDGTTEDKIINLNEKNILGDLEVKNYKIFWEWTGEELELDEQEAIVNANIIVRQVIN